MLADDKRRTGAVLVATRRRLTGRVRLFVGALLGIGVAIVGVITLDATVAIGGALVASTAVGAALVEALLLDRAGCRRPSVGGADAKKASPNIEPGSRETGSGR